MAVDTTIKNNNSLTGNSIAKAAGGNAAANVNFDTFLKLLTTQLKNQDPLNPMDGTQFTGQIAQFSQLEQQINSNAYLKELAEARDYSVQAVATGYLGKEVLVPHSTVVKDADTEVFGYKLDKAAARVEIDIYTENGQGVGTITQKGGEAGPYKVAWDGKDVDGKELPNGKYKIAVRAYDKDGNKIAATPLTYQKVSEVTNYGGEVGLVLADGSVASFDDSYGVKAN